MGVMIGGQIERVNGKELQYREFAERYLRGNQPVLLTGLTEGWRTCEDWVAQDGRPNLEFFATHFGNSRVQLVLRSTLDIWRTQHHHFFIDDWLNLYLDSYSMHQDSDMQHGKNEINCSDYRFVYMGPKGTWTPLHADVFRSYSWSANVCGRKHWFLLPPSQCHLLFDSDLKNSVYDISDEVSEKQFPGFMQAIWYECIQEKGEIIFVPSGWFHQVHNLEDTVSINHNWFNGHNLSFVWNLLVKDYNEAKDYIEDIRDICDNFEWLCQRNLAANTGMNFYDFFMFISRFTLASFVLLFHLTREEKPRFYSSSKVKQLIFNLVGIHNVAKNMESVEAFTKENLCNFSGEDWYALTDINRIMGECRFQEFTMAINKAYELTDEPQEKDLNSSGTSLYASRCLSPSCFGKLNFLQAPVAKICCPSDLISFIEHFFKDPNGIFSSLDVSLFQELHCQISSFIC